MNIITLCFATESALRAEASALWAASNDLDLDLKPAYRLASTRLLRSANALSGENMAQSSPESWHQLYRDQTEQAAKVRLDLARSVALRDKTSR